MEHHDASIRMEPERAGEVGAGTTIEVTERLTSDALSASLRRVLAIAEGPSSAPAAATVSSAIRAEAVDLSGLARGLVDALLDTIEGETHTCRDVCVDGILRSDTGLIGWGAVQVDRSQPARPRAVTIRDIRTTLDTDGTVSIAIDLSSAETERQ